MNQDPPPPGDPNLKPPVPVIDYAEQARQKMAEREKKLDELMERNAKIRQEIKDMDAKEAERKKKQEQRGMEKDQSKDGSESSTSQPERSDAVIELIKLVEREAMRLQIIKDKKAKGEKREMESEGVCWS